MWCLIQLKAYLRSCDILVRRKGSTWCPRYTERWSWRQLARQHDQKITMTHMCWPCHCRRSGYEGRQLWIEWIIISKCYYILINWKHVLLGILSNQMFSLFHRARIVSIIAKYWLVRRMVASMIFTIELN